MANVYFSRWICILAFQYVTTVIIIIIIKKNFVQCECHHLRRHHLVVDSAWAQVRPEQYIKAQDSKENCGAKICVCTHLKSVHGKLHLRQC